MLKTIFCYKKFNVGGASKMKVRLIFCLLFLLVGVVLVIVSKVINNPVKATTTTEPVRAIKSSENVLFGQSLPDSFLQTSCSMKEVNSTPFGFKNPLSPPSSSLDQNNPLLISDRVAYTMVFRLLIASFKIERLVSKM